MKAANYKSIISLGQGNFFNSLAVKASFIFNEFENFKDFGDGNFK